MCVHLPGRKRPCPPVVDVLRSSIAITQHACAQDAMSLYVEAPVACVLGVTANPCRPSRINSASKGQCIAASLSSRVRQAPKGTNLQRVEHGQGPDVRVGMRVAAGTRLAGSSSNVFGRADNSRKSPNWKGPVDRCLHASLQRPGKYRSYPHQRVRGG